MNHTILVVDDEQTIREVLRRYLEHDGFMVYEAEDGEGALTVVNREVPHLVVLDLMLPGVDGWTVARRMRASHPQIPIIMLTALGETRDRIEGLNLGADDYVVKPFSPQEVVARVRAVLRRAESPPPAEPKQARLECGSLTLDPDARSVWLSGELLTLTMREFDLLWFLANHPAQVFTRDQLLDNVWGYEFYGDPATVTVHIRRLREKIEDDPSQPKFIQTVWGVGYKFEVEA